MSSFDPTQYKAGMLERVTLDDFTITMPVSKDKIAPHKGESVWILPYGLSLKDEFDLQQFQEAAARGDNGATDAMFTRICEFMAERIVGWDITDVRGKPYAQPYQNAEAIGAIPSPLFVHLVQAVKGDEPEGKDEAAAPGSPAGSSTSTDSGQTTQGASGDLHPPAN